MEVLYICKYRFLDLLSQEFIKVRENIFRIYNKVLEEMLEEVRDEIMGGR